ncbi:MAG: class I SAM-dependent methyltransferase [Ectothiorhodospiraceae bacterium]|nr:class I SAM-dependent methyltransferase [Ectothiorhodospiraceae bacterium]
MWDERYDSEDYVYGTEPNAFLAAKAGRIPAGGRVLTLAEGEGRNAVFLAERGFRVTGVDASAVGLKKAARLARERGVNVTLEVRDLARADLGEDSWDGVVCIFAHLPPELRRDTHRRVVRALKPGGVLVLEAYTPDQLGRGTGGPPSAELMMTADTLRQEFEGLEIELLRECEREVVEGRGHTGTGAVVQLVARKP